jgi:hypothetical protein
MLITTRAAAGTTMDVIGEDVLITTRDAAGTAMAATGKTIGEDYIAPPSHLPTTFAFSSPVFCHYTVISVSYVT